MKTFNPKTDIHDGDGWITRRTRAGQYSIYHEICGQGVTCFSVLGGYKPIGDAKLTHDCPMKFKAVALAVVEWAKTPGKHGGNPYCWNFVQLALDALKEPAPTTPTSPTTPV